MFYSQEVPDIKVIAGSTCPSIEYYSVVRSTRMIPARAKRKISADRTSSLKKKTYTILCMYTKNDVAQNMKQPSPVLGYSIDYVHGIILQHIVLYHTSSVSVCNRQCRATLDRPPAKAANRKTQSVALFLVLTGLLLAGVSCWTKGLRCRQKFQCMTPHA